MKLHYAVAFCGIIIMYFNHEIEANMIIESFSQLRDIPLIDNSCIVDTRILDVCKNDHWIYNASIFALADDNYLVTIRHTSAKPRVSRIGFLLYNKNFEQLSPIYYFNSPRAKSKDARIFVYKGDLYVLFTSKNSGAIKTDECLSRLDDHLDPLETLTLGYGTRGNQNWTPFEYRRVDNSSKLYFIYQFNPLTILYLDKNKQIKEFSTAFGKNPALSAWEEKWGMISGGTPALLVDNEYWTFFHSHFEEDGKRFYVFGALTFQAKPPFNITRISKYPILHEKFYTTHEFGCTPMSPPVHAVLFPCGFVHKKIDKKDLFHVLCGENEEAVRLITIDKNRLLKHMQNVHT